MVVVSNAISYSRYVGLHFIKDPRTHVLLQCEVAAVIFDRPARQARFSCVRLGRAGGSALLYNKAPRRGREVREKI